MKEFIKSTFLKLTSKTYPYGYEDDFVVEMQGIDILPKNLEKDNQGNYFLKIGDSRTIFASHFDTACKDQVKVNHIINGDIIKTDGTSILGADDKAGVTIMLWMIKHNIPGLYYFFFGEEVGCIGSGLAAKFIQVKGLYDRIISFDRRGTSSIITHQSYSRTCSDEFGKELAKQLNKKSQSFDYKIDDTGVYTDSAEFTSVIPECTNVSVGYYQEHTTNEHQNIQHLTDLAFACLSVDWENLPTKRDMNKVESKWSKYESTYGGTYRNNNTTSWNSRGFSKGNKTWNNSNFSEYGNSEYDDFYVNKTKTKTRRGNKKSNREFYDNGSELLEITGKDFEIEDRINSKLTSKYEPIKEKFLNTSLSREEIEIIKEQYLDLNDPNDRDVYEVIINSLVY